MLRHIVKMTNLRFENTPPRSKTYRKRWPRLGITLNDLVRFLGLMVLFTLCKQPRNELFWLKESLCPHDITKTTKISYHKYRLMKRYMSCNDPEQPDIPVRGQDFWDPLFLIRPLYDCFRAQLRKMQKAPRRLAIDEFMIACKLRTFLKQLVKGKVESTAHAENAPSTR